MSSRGFGAGGKKEPECLQKAILANQVHCCITIQAGSIDESSVIDNHGHRFHESLGVPSEDMLVLLAQCKHQDVQVITQ